MTDCSACGVADVDAPICPACDRLLPVAERTDHFAALGLERKMAIDGGAIDKAFRERSRRVHPDRFPREDPTARRLALAHTERVNQAYRCLKDPQRRAEHLFALSGVEVASETERTEDPEFLMRMLERQEAVEEAEDEDALAELEKEAKGRQRMLLARAEAWFDRGEGDAETVRRGLSELRYVRRLLERIKARFEELD